MMKQLGLLPLMGAFTLLGVGCASPRTNSPPAPPSIIVVSVEAFRPDVLSVYGGELHMDSIEELRAGGIVFDDAATVSPTTRVAAATLLTGLAPDRLRVRDNFYDHLPADVISIAAALRERGYETVGLVATPFVGYTSGLDRGFDLFDAPNAYDVGPERYVPAVREDGEISRGFRRWLQARKSEQPFFAWLHFGALRAGLFESEDPGSVATRYREGLTRLDDAVGEVLAAVRDAGLFGQAAIILLGTDGLLLGEDGAVGGAYWLRVETLRVPLIISAPGVRPGRSGRPVWLPDVPATIAELTGVQLDPRSEGTSLLAPVAAEQARRRMAWTWAPDEDFAWPPLTAIDRGGGWVMFRWSELYAARSTDDEDVASRELASERAATPRPRNLPQEIREAIEEAGLVTSWDEEPAPEPNSPEREELIRRVQHVRYLFRKDRAGVKEARRELRIATRELIESAPGNLATIADRLYFLVRWSAGRRAKAMRARALERYPQRPEVLHWAGHVAMLLGNLAEAELLWRAALALVPTHPDVLYDVACAESLRGDVDQALQSLEAAIRAGFRNWDHIERDQDLGRLRADRRFAELLRRYR